MLVKKICKIGILLASFKIILRMQTKRMLMEHTHVIFLFTVLLQFDKNHISVGYNIINLTIILFLPIFDAMIRI